MTYLLGSMDVETFLSDYWQKKPLLIRQGCPQFRSPLDRDELAGLAMEPDIESRLVKQIDGHYHLEHGPFSEDKLSTLTAKDWTLLVQDVDKFIPEVANLRERISFIPGWRMDDIMISYAADQGSVGPHIDLYDVFLLQAEGKRTWHIEDAARQVQDLDEKSSLRVLKNFYAAETWTLEPGDVLYLPPGIPHFGIANGPCMTWSFGFRAPSYANLSSAMGDLLNRSWPDDELFQDKTLTAKSSHGEITAETIAHIKEQLLKKWSQSDWKMALGSLFTSPKENYQTEALPEEETPTAKEIMQALANKATFQRDPAALISFIEDRTDQCLLFANGKPVEGHLPRAICEQIASPNLSKTFITNQDDLPKWVKALSALIAGGCYDCEDL